MEVCVQVPLGGKRIRANVAEDPRNRVMRRTVEKRGIFGGKEGQVGRFHRLGRGNHARNVETSGLSPSLQSITPSVGNLIGSGEGNCSMADLLCARGCVDSSCAVLGGLAYVILTGKLGASSIVIFLIFFNFVSFVSFLFIFILVQFLVLY